MLCTLPRAAGCTGPALTDQQDTSTGSDRYGSGREGRGPLDLSRSEALHYNTIVFCTRESCPWEPAMPFRYLDHQADIGILSWGPSIEEAFADGARALFGVMAETDAIDPREETTIECTADEESLLFVEMLNTLISQSDLTGLLYCDITVERIERSGEHLRLVARAAGEKIDFERHELKTEVKAATYSGLRYTCREGTHSLQCLLDI